MEYVIIGVDPHKLSATIEVAEAPGARGPVAGPRISRRSRA